MAYKNNLTSLIFIAHLPGKSKDQMFAICQLGVSFEKSAAANLCWSAAESVIFCCPVEVALNWRVTFHISIR